jgi:hypothetical protein
MADMVRDGDMTELDAPAWPLHLGIRKVGCGAAELIAMQISILSRGSAARLSVVRANEAGACALAFCPWHSF